MISIYQGKDFDEQTLRSRRKNVKDENIEAIVSDIIENVKQNGDAALRDYCRRFDHAEINDLRVSTAEIDAAWNNTDEAFREVLTEAAYSGLSQQATSR